MLPFVRVCRSSNYYGTYSTRRYRTLEELMKTSEYKDIKRWVDSRPPIKPTEVQLDFERFKRDHDNHWIEHQNFTSNFDKFKLDFERFKRDHDQHWIEFEQFKRDHAKFSLDLDRAKRDLEKFIQDLDKNK